MGEKINVKLSEGMEAKLSKGIGAELDVGIEAMLGEKMIAKLMREVDLGCRNGI